MDFNRLTALALTVALFAFAIASSWVVLAVFEGAPVWRSRRRSGAGQQSLDSHAGVGPSKHLKVAFWLVYGTGLAALAASCDDAAASMPLLLIALGLPLAFRLVPRNWLYGMRSPRTLLTTEETWYRQNVITGVAFVMVGTVWLVVLAVKTVVPD